MSEILAVPTVVVSASTESGVRPSPGALEGPSGNGEAFSRMLQDVAGGRPASPEVSDEDASAGPQPEEEPPDDQPSEESATVPAVVDHLLTGVAELDSAAQTRPTPVDETTTSTAAPVETLVETMSAFRQQGHSVPIQNGGGAGLTEEVGTAQAQAMSQPVTTSGSDSLNVVVASSTTVQEDGQETQVVSGPATGRSRTDGAMRPSSDWQLAVAAPPGETDVSPSGTGGPAEPRLMGPQGDPPSVSAAAKEPPPTLYGGQQVGKLPISDDRQSLSSPVSPGGDQPEWVMSITPLDDPASSAKTAQDHWGGNGEAAGSGSTFHGEHAQGPAQAGQTPFAGQGSEPRSPVPLSDPVRPTLPSAVQWDTSSSRAMRLDLPSPDGQPLRLHVSLVEQTVYAKIVTDQPDVQDFLLRNQSRLESQLHNHGLEMGQFSVSVDRQGQEPLSYGWEKIWQQSNRRSGEGAAPTEVDAGGSASFDAGEPRRVNLFA